MITEDYCSFEVSKLLKEKDFEGICDYAYSNKGNYFEIDRSNFDEVYCLRPTHQMAMVWLREVHHYYIQVMLDSWACEGHSGYYVVIQKTDSDFELMLSDVLDDVFYDTYEDAVKAALKYCLENLI